jgi:hypothetical protein
MDVEVSASFQIGSESLSAAELLQRTRLAASEVYNKGDPISPRQGSRAYKQSIVRVTSSLPGSSSLMEHLEHLVAAIEKSAPDIARLPPECSREIWIKVSHGSEQLGLELPARVLSTLAPLNVSIYFDIYGS